MYQLLQESLIKDHVMEDEQDEIYIPLQENTIELDAACIT